MNDRVEALADDAWYAWETAEPEQGWLLSYVDVLSVILAMLLVLLVSRLQPEEMPGAAAAPLNASTAPVPAEAIHAAVALAPSSLPAQRPVQEPAAGQDPAQEMQTVAAVETPRVEVETPTPAAEVMQEHEAAAEMDVATMAIEGVELVHHAGGFTVQIDDVILFDSSQAVLKPTAAPVLERTTAVLREIGQATIAVQGHTDNRPVQGGVYRSNWELAAARANAVAAFLLQQGFAPEQLRVESYADTRPVAENASDAGRAKNRRVELLVELGDPLSR